MIELINSLPGHIQAAIAVAAIFAVCVLWHWSAQYKRRLLAADHKPVYDGRYAPFIIAGCLVVAVLCGLGWAT